MADGLSQPRTGPALAVFFFLLVLQNSALGLGTLMGLGMITAHLMTPGTLYVPTEHSQQKAKHRDLPAEPFLQPGRNFIVFYLICFSLGKLQLVETSTLRRIIEM